MSELKLIFSLFFSANVATFTHASALDISGQSIGAFLQEDNYAEISYINIDTQIKGSPEQANIKDNVHIIDAHNHVLSMGLKKQLGPKLALGLLYDQPFQLDSDYYEQNKKSKEYLPNRLNAHIDTENLTFLTGYQLNPSFGIFAGPVYQHLKGNFKISGEVYGSSAQYISDLHQDDAFGYIIGVTYNFPKIYLKMDLSYRSEIKHNLSTLEKVDFPLILPQAIQSLSHSKLITPESINLNFQMAVYQNTLLMLNSRWVKWSKFKLQADLFSDVSAFIDGNHNLNSEDEALIQYHKDQWSFNLGLARKFSDQWAGFVMAGYDSGESILNNNTSAKNWLTGLVVQYNLIRKYEFSAGIFYIKIDDSAQNLEENVLSKRISNSLVEYNNSSLAYLFKFGYRF